MSLDNSVLFGSSVKLPDYDNKDPQKEIQKFKEDLSRLLNLPAEQIDVILKNGHLKARFKVENENEELKAEANPLKKADVLHLGDKIENIVNKQKEEEKFKEVVITFEDKTDLNRFGMYAAKSKSSGLAHLGESGREIKIPNYDNNQSREQDIKLFKEDVARLMGDAIENIEIRTMEDEIFVSTVGKPERIRVTFSDAADKNRLLKLAKQSKSIRLIHFGEKKEQTTINSNIASGYPDPKSKTKFTQSLDYETFLGEDGVHKIKVGVAGEGGLVGDYGIQNVKRVTIGYSNANLGEAEISYDPSKNSVSLKGKSQILDKKLNEFKDNLLKGDPTSIAIAVGAVALVAGGVAIAANTLKEEKDFKLPIEGKIYDNGKFSLKGRVDTKITGGDHHFKVGIVGGGIETKENIGSGVSSTQKVKYDDDEKKLESEVKVEYKGLNVTASNNYKFDDETQTRTHVGVGYSHSICKNMDGSISYQQDFNHEWKSENHAVGLGLTIRPTENISVGLGFNVGMPNIHEKPNYGASIGVSMRF